MLSYLYDVMKPVSDQRPGSLFAEANSHYKGSWGSIFRAAAADSYAYTSVVNRTVVDYNGSWGSIYKALKGDEEAYNSVARELTVDPMADYGYRDYLYNSFSLGKMSKIVIKMLMVLWIMLSLKTMSIQDMALKKWSIFTSSTSALLFALLKTRREQPS